MVLAALIDLAPSGVEQVDGEGFVEYAVYGAPGELPSLPEGEADVGGVRVSVRGEEVPDDWAERWKRFHAPVLIAGSLYVRPPWEEPAVRPGVTEVVIDPGRAFGTGAHATTRLSLELMLDLDPAGSFADLGCGSGVLAIAASKLGFDPVIAFDSDRLAVEATVQNAARQRRPARPGGALRPARRPATRRRHGGRQPHAPAAAAPRGADAAPPAHPDRLRPAGRRGRRDGRGVRAAHGAQAAVAPGLVGPAACPEPRQAKNCSARSSTKSGRSSWMKCPAPFTSSTPISSA